MNAAARCERASSIAGRMFLPKALRYDVMSPRSSHAYAALVYLSFSPDHIRVHSLHCECAVVVKSRQRSGLSKCRAQSYHCLLHLDSRSPHELRIPCRPIASGSFSCNATRHQHARSVLASYRPHKGMGVCTDPSKIQPGGYCTHSPLFGSRPVSLHLFPT